MPERRDDGLEETDLGGGRKAYHAPVTSGPVLEDASQYRQRIRELEAERDEARRQRDAEWQRRKEYRERAYKAEAELSRLCSDETARRVAMRIAHEEAGIDIPKKGAVFTARDQRRATIIQAELAGGEEEKCDDCAPGISEGCKGCEYESPNVGDGVVSRMKARRLLTSWGWVPVTGAPGDRWQAPNCASGSMSCPIEMALEHHGYKLEEE